MFHQMRISAHPLEWTRASASHVNPLPQCTTLAVGYWEEPRPTLSHTPTPSGCGVGCEGGVRGGDSVEACLHCGSVLLRMQWRDFQSKPVVKSTVPSIIIITWSLETILIIV